MYYCKTVVIILFLTILFLSCKEKNNEEQKSNQLYIKIDNSTPVKLLNNIWRYSIFADTLAASYDKSSIYYTLYSKGFWYDFIGNNREWKNNGTCISI